MGERDSGTERQPLPGARLDDLDLHLVRRHIATAIERRGYEGPTEPRDYLHRYHCLTGSGSATVPTLAGILTFTPEPDRWMSAAGIDIAQFQGDHAHSTDLQFSRQIRGPIVDVIDRTVELLWARSDHRYRLEGTERIEEHAYAPVVLRELTVNALCHRDWSYTGSLVRIQIFPNCIEWVTPGGLPPGVTVDTLRTAQVSRNPAIAQLLYHAGQVEKFGMGVDTVLDILSEWGCDPPVLRDDGHFFTFRVWGKPLSPHELPDDPYLTSRQQRVLAELDQRRVCTSADLARALGEPRRNIQRDLQALIAAGLVVTEGSTTRSRYRRART
jgi:predicted HTH transcriptional regulator